MKRLDEEIYCEKVIHDVLDKKYIQFLEEEMSQMIGMHLYRSGIINFEYKDGDYGSKKVCTRFRPYLLKSAMNILDNIKDKGKIDVEDKDKIIEILEVFEKRGMNG